ncbi:hypothetical protein LTR36_002475 [Oleoguttula mirabilis]|uniref:Uncharacterized protein n=1 Tax=Oleoguttula mirabilis TaxID=1507867 RepID=A0AAV9JLL8_9PEZI|nr:hypothetical protein LTR36_002475 [Oleoguttula mirabilis]
MAAQPSSQLFRLPPELRLLIYEAYLDSLPRHDALDVAILRSFDVQHEAELDQRKTYSFLFAHRTIHHEALPLVMKTHPLIFYNVMETSRLSKESVSCLASVQTAVLDFTSGAKGDIARGIGHLASLTSLTTLTIYPPQTQDDSDHESLYAADFGSWCPRSTLMNLKTMRFVDKDEERRQQARRRESTKHDAEIAELEELEKKGTMKIYGAVKLTTLRVCRVLNEVLELSRLLRRDGRFHDLNWELEAALLRKASERASAKHSLSCGMKKKLEDKASGEV